MALEALEGKMVFLEGSGVFVEFFSGGEFWRERIEILAKFQKISEIFGGFLGCLEGLGPNRNYFSKTKGPAAVFQRVQGWRHNLQQAQGFLCKVHGILMN
jgi:hypothetical protein